MKPIPFSTPMVEAILRGDKTQTRRVVKGEHLDWLNYGFTPELVADPENCFAGTRKVGDILWVRESFKWEGDTFWKDAMPVGQFYYKADDPEGLILGYKPGRFMPKIAARIFLRVTAVRIERLNDISSGDAIAEGVKFVWDDQLGRYIYRNYLKPSTTWNDPVTSFYSLWESVNGKGSWSANPWIWVIEFERIEKPENI